MTTSAPNSSSPSAWEDCDSYSLATRTTSPGMLTLTTTTVLEVFLGAPTNLWLISHILRKKSKVGSIPTTDYFPFHLAIAHIIFYLIAPLYVANHFLWHSTGVFILVVVGLSMVLGMKPVLLCMGCVERYLAVVHPVLYLRHKSSRCRLWALCFSWSVFLLIGVLTLLKSSPIIICLVFLPVMLVDTICSVSILCRLRRPPPGDTERTGGMNSMKRKAFITIIITQVVLTFNYVPSFAAVSLMSHPVDLVVMCESQSFAFSAAVCASYLQPLLYLHKLGLLPFMAPSAAHR